MALIGISLIVASFIFVCLRPPEWLHSFLSTLGQKRLGDGGPSPPRAPPPPPRRPSPTINSSDPEEDEDIKKDGVQKPAAPSIQPPPHLEITDSSSEVQENEEEEEEEGQTTPRATTPTPGNDVVPGLVIPEASSSLLSSTTAPDVVLQPPTAASDLMPPPPLPTTTISRPRPSGIPQPRASTSSSSSSSSPSPRRIPTLNGTLDPAPTRERNLPVPRRGAPLSGRTAASSSSGSSLFPPPTATSIPKKPSRQVALEPGHSPLDWARLAQSPTSDLRGLGPDAPYLRVTPSMLRQQNGRKGRDAWTAFGGKVYNIHPYIPFHPGGGPELLRGAGKDGTRLFAEVHPWVNYETMLQSCLIGLLVEENESGNKMEEMD